MQAGDRLTEGPLDPHKVLELQGVRGVMEYLVREIQNVYKSQGVDINDKHVEIIVRQMLRKRKVVESGDCRFLPGQVVDKFDFEDENARVRSIGGTEATAEWVLLGITEASLATDSFLSAASFQKTTRVLTDAAVKGKRDNLIGLKENVIIGRLIPAGTGLPRYKQIEVLDEENNPITAVRSFLRPTEEEDEEEGLIPDEDVDLIADIFEAPSEEILIDDYATEEAVEEDEQEDDVVGLPVAPVEVVEASEEESEDEEDVEEDAPIDTESESAI